MGGGHESVGKVLANTDSDLSWNLQELGTMYQYLQGTCRKMGSGEKTVFRNPQVA